LKRIRTERPEAVAYQEARTEGFAHVEEVVVVRRPRKLALSLFLMPAMAVLMATPAGAGVTGSWQVVPNPAPVQLYGVAAVQSNDVWAAGNSNIEHWNGSSWSVSLFNYGVFSSIAAVSSTDVWAVGTGAASAKTFHWDGAAWTQLAPAGQGFLGDVEAVSSTEVWAVGGDGLGTMVQRWNGSAWSVVPSQDPPTGWGSFSAVSAASSTDIWAVGNTIDGVLVHPLIEHWNGSAWSIVPAPATSTELSLGDVAAVARNDVWAVGFARKGGTFQPRILHWNGVKWAFSKVPALPPNGTLEGVAARSSTDVWAVGSVPNTQGYPRTLILHWGGSAWTRVKSPNPGGPSASNTLYDVTTLPSGEAWAVGDDGLIERFVP
jgi:hypothetical protein